MSTTMRTTDTWYKRAGIASAFTEPVTKAQN